MSSASNITLAMSGRSSTISAGVANAQREEPAGGTRGQMICLFREEIASERALPGISGR